jgi:ankyrin repeat protein
VHLLVGADRSSKHSAGGSGGGGGSGAGSGGGSASGGGDSPGGATANGSPGGGGSGSGGGGSGSRDESASANSGGGSGDSAPRAMDADADAEGRGSGSAPRDPSFTPTTTSTKTSGGGGGGGGGGTAGASFARKAVAALGAGDILSDPDAMSDEDVARTFKTALDARLRYAISAEAKSLRARAVTATAAEGSIPVPTFSQPRTAYARVDAGGVGMIHCVAALGMNWAIPAMCKSGCDVNQPDRRHRTALHWAAAKGHEDTVATLLASGANIRATARWGAGGYTAADLAAALGHGGIAAYISETSLAASLSNISLYGGPSGAARRPGAGLPIHPRRPGSGFGAHRVGAASRLPAQSAAGGALEGVSSPMVADVKSPGGGVAAGVRASRVAGGAPKMPSLLLATETEVTATDFDSRTDITDLETDAGEHLGGAGMGDEERREKMAAGMIQLAFRKHAVRRRKLRRKVAGSGLGSVEEVAEAKAKTPGGDDDSEDDEDVKKDVKKVVKKAEKAALKITSSIRSLKTNKNQPTEDPGLGKRGRRGGESRGDVAAERVEEEKMPRTPSEQALAEVHRRVERLRARAVVLTEEVHQRRGSAPLRATSLPPRTTHRRRVPAGDIMQLVKVSGLAGSAHRLEALEAMHRSASKSPKGSPAGTSKSKSKSGGEANAGDEEEEEEEEGGENDPRLDGVEEEDGVKSGIKSGLRRAGRKTTPSGGDDDDDDDDEDDEEDDDDEEEEDAKVAVSRIQAIVRSRQAREQYLRLRSVTMSLQERIAARARGETPMDDADGDDIEVDDEDEDEDQGEV